jgi:hypothetical protein
MQIMKAQWQIKRQRQKDVRAVLFCMQVTVIVAVVVGLLALTGC